MTPVRAKPAPSGRTLRASRQAVASWAGSIRELAKALGVPPETLLVDPSIAIGSVFLVRHYDWESQEVLLVASTRAAAQLYVDRASTCTHPPRGHGGYTKPQCVARLAAYGRDLTIEEWELGAESPKPDPTTDGAAR